MFFIIGWAYEMLPNELLQDQKSLSLVGPSVLQIPLAQIVRKRSVDQLHWSSISELFCWNRDVFNEYRSSLHINELNTVFPDSCDNKTKLVIIVLEYTHSSLRRK